MAYASEAEQRNLVDRIARSFVGTPFVDCGEVKGPNGGVDCATTLKLVFREAGLIPDIKLQHYSPQHFLHQDSEQFLAWVLQFMREIPESEVSHGDVVLFHVGRVYAHGAIVIKPGLPNIVHAYYRARQVQRSRIQDNEFLCKSKRKPRFFSRW